jgi:cytochrome c peroxidase
MKRSRLCAIASRALPNAGDAACLERRARLRNALMKSSVFPTLSAILLFTALAAACDKEAAPPVPPAQQAPPPPPPADPLPADKLGAFAPVPEVIGDAAQLTEAKVQLGRQLFFDKRLSVNGTQACNSCHNLATFGVDNQPTSTGAKGEKGGRNSPTVLNAALHATQFWDGRAATVEDQAKGPILNPIEMGMKDDKAVVAALKKVKGYPAAFKAAFPDAKEPITFDNYAAAVGAFERKLTTPSKWDAFLKGDKSALSDAEKQGAAKFLEVGCVSCHMGPALGGGMFQKLGVVKPWKAEEKDMGRFEVTKSEADKLFFKVPGLRNIEMTAPYFHDGSVATLEEAVKLMGTHQLGRDLDDAAVASIVTFLKALTGAPPAALIAEPTPL